MADLLELLLNFVLEILLEILELDRAWRFYLPVLSGLGVAALICWRVSNSGAQFVLSAPLVVAGFATGITWQARKR